ncbi:enoyl-CoA hydratase/isomerase family protein [Halegenticoccus tardaugens]|uniref:enoyl-CoA hydratase/isomerase family protein n=1 Tax=Halegenticoccus tardaugens TaxID=2071624 RepID=UPI00100BB396|nr:enoyl-CoA hydratase/isomerase family protein [Halegenticoccus tardaugens]
MIRTTDADELRTVTLDRPDRRNALRPADLDELETAVTETDASIVFLRGAGDAFCAGADLDALAELSDPASFARRGQRVADAIETADPVVVAGIDGAARGGGVELALACDLRVATPAATFAEPGVRFGLFGAWGGTIRLRRVLREGDAFDFALSGSVVDAEEALRIGLVSRVVSDPRTVVAALASNKLDALRTIKKRLRDRRGRDEREAAEAIAFERLMKRYAGEIAAEWGGRDRTDGDG